MHWPNALLCCCNVLLHIRESTNEMKCNIKKSSRKGWTQLFCCYWTFNYAIPISICVDFRSEFVACPPYIIKYSFFSHDAFDDIVSRGECIRIVFFFYFLLHIHHTTHFLYIFRSAMNSEWMMIVEGNWNERWLIYGHRALCRHLISSSSRKKNIYYILIWCVCKEWERDRERESNIHF